MAPDPNTNQLGGEDANGNAAGYLYDAENRNHPGVGNSNGIQYVYDAQNKRTWSWPGTLDTLNNRNAYTVFFYTEVGQTAAMMGHPRERTRCGIREVSRT